MQKKQKKQTKALKYPRRPKHDSQMIKKNKKTRHCTDALFCDLSSHKAALHKMCSARTCDKEAAPVVSLEQTEQQAKCGRMFKCSQKEELPQTFTLATSSCEQETV